MALCIPGYLGQLNKNHLICRTTYVVVLLFKAAPLKRLAPRPSRHHYWSKAEQSISSEFNSFIQSPIFCRFFNSATSTTVNSLLPKQNTFFNFQTWRPKFSCKMQPHLLSSYSDRRPAQEQQATLAATHSSPFTINIPTTSMLP
jgi:hypothetical protein